LLEAASQLNKGYFVSEQAQMKKEFGLLADEATEILIKSKDKTLWALILGKKDSESGRYAKLPDSDQIFTVRGTFGAMLRSVKDWRDRDIWHLAEPDAVFFTVENPKQKFALSKDEKTQEWNIAESTPKVSPTFRVDKNALASFVRSHLNLRANNFVDNGELKTLLFTIKAKSKDGKESELLVYDGDKDHYWVKKSGNGQIYEIVKANFDRFNLPIEKLRDLKILSFDKDSITKLSLHSGKTPVIIEKKEGQWSVSQPKQLPPKFEFDPATVTAFLEQLTELRGARVKDALKDKPENPKWQQSSLVELSNEGKTVHLYASKISKNKNDYLLKGNIDEEVYVVPSLKLGKIFQGIEAFRKVEMPPINENTQGFESLPPELQRQLMEMRKQK
jgi:hypothetical protein